MRRTGGWIVLSGVLIGFLTGLSVSPVTSIVLTSVVAVVVATTSAVAAITSKAGDSNPDARAWPEVNPMPVAVLLVGITAGSMIGIFTRSHDWLGTIQSSRTGTTTLSTMSDTEQKARSGVLFRAETSECNDWRTISEQEPLRERLKKGVPVDSSLSRIISGCRDLDCLRAVTELRCDK